MAKHNLFTSTTDVEVYISESSSPWRRGSSEKANVVVRQYFIKAVWGLFAGVGGIEQSSARSGHRSILLCENDLRSACAECPAAV